jgi:hypothetical protein
LPAVTMTLPSLVGHGLAGTIRLHEARGRPTVAARTGTDPDSYCGNRAALADEGARRRPNSLLGSGNASGR